MSSLLLPKNLVEYCYRFVNTFHPKIGQYPVTDDLTPFPQKINNFTHMLDTSHMSPSCDFFEKNLLTPFKQNTLLQMS